MGKETPEIIAALLSGKDPTGRLWRGFGSAPRAIVTPGTASGASLVGGPRMRRAGAIPYSEAKPAGPPQRVGERREPRRINGL
jgi:hypothetical protein